MQRLLHADVLAILGLGSSESPAANMAVGAHKVSQQNMPELSYTIDWDIEYEIQTNVITPDPTWEDAKIVQQNGGRIRMQLPNGRFLARNLADENKTWRKKAPGSSPPPDAKLPGVQVVETDVGAPGVMMSDRDKKKLILMLKRIDEMHERKNTPNTTAGVQCAAKKKKVMVEDFPVPSASDSSLDHSTRALLSSHESMKSPLADGDSIDTTSQHQTIDSYAMDLVALDQRGMDGVALNVGQVGGAVDAAPEQVRKIAREKLMTQCLEAFISKAVQNKDGCLTMRKCKAMLATHFGQPSVEEEEIIELAVARLVSQYKAVEQQQAAGAIPFCLVL
jgi:hypothetical protein